MNVAACQCNVPDIQSELRLQFAQFSVVAVVAQGVAYGGQCFCKAVPVSQVTCKGNGCMDG